MNTRITSEADLKSVSSLLHDARFTVNAIEFDSASHTFVLTCWVLESRQEGSVASRYWKGCRLSFANVSDCKLNIREAVSYYELATIRLVARDQKLDFVTHYGIDISLIIGELDGTLEKTNETRERWN